MLRTNLKFVNFKTSKQITGFKLYNFNAVVLGVWQFRKTNIYFVLKSHEMFVFHVN